MTKSKQQNLLPTKSKKKDPSSTGAKTFSFPNLPNVEKLILATFVQVKSDVNELLHLCSTWREKERMGAETFQSSVAGYYEKKVTAYLKDFFARRRALVKAEYERSKSTLASEGFEEEANVSHLIAKTDKATKAAWSSETLKDTKADFPSTDLNIVDTHRLSEEQKDELKKSQTFFQKLKAAFGRLRKKKSHKKTPQTKKKHLDDDIVDSKSDESSSRSGIQATSSTASATSTETSSVFEEPFTEGGKEKRKSEETETLYTELPYSLQKKSTDIYISRHKESADETKSQKESSYSDSIEHEEPPLGTTSYFGLSGHTKLSPGEAISSTESDVIEVEGYSEDEESEVEDSKNIFERVKSALSGLRKRKSRKKTQQTDDDLHTSSESEDEESYSQSGTWVTSPSPLTASTDICSVFVELITEGGKEECKSEKTETRSSEVYPRPFPKLTESLEEEYTVTNLIPKIESTCETTAQVEPSETHSESKEPVDKPVDKPVVTTLRSQAEVGKEEYKSEKTETRPSEVYPRPISKLTKSIEEEYTVTDLIAKTESTCETAEQVEPLEAHSESKELVDKPIVTTLRSQTEVGKEEYKSDKVETHPSELYPKPFSKLTETLEVESTDTDLIIKIESTYETTEQIEPLETQSESKKVIDKDIGTTSRKQTLKKASVSPGSFSSSTVININEEQKPSEDQKSERKIYHTFYEKLKSAFKGITKSQSQQKAQQSGKSLDKHKVDKSSECDVSKASFQTGSRAKSPTPLAVSTKISYVYVEQITEGGKEKRNEWKSDTTETFSKPIQVEPSPVLSPHSQEPNYTSSVKRELDFSSNSETQNEEEIQPGIEYMRKMARCMSSVDSSEFTHTACDLIVSKIQDLHLDSSDQRDNEWKSNKAKPHSKTIRVKSSLVPPTHAQDLNDVSDAPQLDLSSFCAGSIMEAENEELKSEQAQAVVKSEVSATSSREQTDEKHIQIKLDVQKKLASIPSEHLADLKQSVVTTIMGVFDFIAKNPTQYLRDTTKIDTITNTLITSVESIFESPEMQSTSSTGGASKYPEMAIPSETSSTKSCCSRCKDQDGRTIKYECCFSRIAEQASTRIPERSGSLTQK